MAGKTKASPVQLEWMQTNLGAIDQFPPNRCAGDALNGRHLHDDFAGADMDARRRIGDVVCACDLDVHDHAVHRTPA